MPILTVKEISNATKELTAKRFKELRLVLNFQLTLMCVLPIGNTNIKRKLTQEITFQTYLTHATLLE